MTSEQQTTIEADAGDDAPSGRGCLTSTLVALGLTVVVTIAGFYWIVDQGPRLLRGTVEAGVIDELRVRDEQEQANLRKQFDRLQTLWDDGQIDTRGLIRIAEDLEGLLYSIEYWPKIRDAIENYYELRLAAAPNDIEREAIEKLRSIRLRRLEKAFCYMIRGLYSIERLHDAVVVPFLEDPESTSPVVRTVTEDILERVDIVIWGEIVTAKLDESESPAPAESGAVSEEAGSEEAAVTSSEESAPKPSAPETGFVRFVEKNKVKRPSDGFSGMEFSKFVGAAIDAHASSKEE